MSESFTSNKRGRMERKAKSPVLARHISGENPNKIWKLYHKNWLISEDGTYHSPTEEELGDYLEVDSGPFEEKITYYDVVKGAVTLKFRKLL